MRIAFTSCMSLQVFPQQAVWDWIAARNPDHLLLLGDSMYLDVHAPRPPRKMGDDEFARHLQDRFRRQLAQPQFDALLKQIKQRNKGQVHAVWDDHDFLWDNAAGAAIRRQPTQRDKIPLSNATFRMFRAALNNPGGFPPQYDNSVFLPANQQALETPSIKLAPQVWLHLSDGRSLRTETKTVTQAKRHLLGEAQRAAFEVAMAPHPDAVHLFANGSTTSEWTDFPNDWEWLKTQASQRRTLLLTGDVHFNDVHAFHTGGLPLHEATASGAAIKDLVIYGDARHNYGLLDITASEVQLRLFQMNVETPIHHRRYSRSSWLPTN